MPITQEQLDELQNQIDELKEQQEERENKFIELEKLTKDHEHTGSESKRLEDLIKRLSYIDGKKFRVAGTAGKDATATIRNAAGDGSCTLIFTNGIINGGTCF